MVKIATFAALAALLGAAAAGPARRQLSLEEVEARVEAAREGARLLAAAPDEMMRELAGTTDTSITQACPTLAAAADACCANANGDDASTFTMSGFDEDNLDGCYIFVSNSLGGAIIDTLGDAFANQFTAPATATYFSTTPGADLATAIDNGSYSLAVYASKMKIYDADSGETYSGPGWAFVNVQFDAADGDNPKTVNINTFVCQTQANSNGLITPPAQSNLCYGYKEEYSIQNGSVIGSYDTYTDGGIDSACGCKDTETEAATFNAAPAAGLAAGAIAAAVAVAQLLL